MIWTFVTFLQIPNLSIVAYGPERVKKSKGFFGSDILKTFLDFHLKLWILGELQKTISELWLEQFWFKLSAILNILYGMWRKTVGKNKLSVLKTVAAIEFPEMEFNENPAFQFRNTFKEAENWFSDYFVRHIEKKLYEFSEAAKFRKMYFQGCLW